MRTTTNSWSVVPPFLMWNVTGPAGAVMLPRSTLNSDSVAATVVADPDPEASQPASPRRMPEARELAMRPAPTAEPPPQPPPALLHPMINAPAALTAMA